MARVQYSNPQKGINITRGMAIPRRNMDQLESWYKAAQKAIREIPDPVTEDYVKAHPEFDLWYLFSQPRAGLDFIKFELRNALEEKSYVVIDRKASSIGT